MYDLFTPFNVYITEIIQYIKKNILKYLTISWFTMKNVFANVDNLKCITV